MLKTRHMYKHFAELLFPPLCCRLSVSIRCESFSYSTRQQKNIRKGTSLLLDGSLGDAPSSELVSFFCLITSSVTSYQMHLLHISFSLLRDVALWENTHHQFGLHRQEQWTAVTSPSRISSSLLTQVCVLWCVPPSGHGNGWVRLTSELRSSLWCHWRLSFMCGQGEIQWNKPSVWEGLPQCYPNRESPLLIYIVPERRGIRATGMSDFCVNTILELTISSRQDFNQSGHINRKHLSRQTLIVALLHPITKSGLWYRRKGALISLGLNSPWEEAKIYIFLLTLGFVTAYMKIMTRSCCSQTQVSLRSLLCGEKNCETKTHQTTGRPRIVYFSY